MVYRKAVAFVVLALVLLGASVPVQADMGCPDGVAGWEALQNGWGSPPDGVQTFGADVYRIEVRHRQASDGSLHDLVDVLALSPSVPIHGVCLATGIEIGVQSFGSGVPAVRWETQPLALRVRVW